MKIAKKRLYAASFILALCIFNFNIQQCISKPNTATEEEEKQFTEADKIKPNALSSLQNRSYDEGITIKEIEIKGNNLIKNDDIIGKLTIKVGSRFERDSLQKDLKTIYDMGYFTEKLRAVPESSPEGIKLRIEVEENAPVTGFNITGNKVISTEDLAKIFNNQTGLPQNIAELNKSVTAIESLYADKGYILAKVKSISDDPDGMVNIQINEGVIDDIKISGNTKTKDFVVKRNMATKVGSVYNENILKQDLSRIYGTQSFSDVRRVLTASPTDPDKYKLTVEVDEKRTGSISLGGGLDTGTGLFGSLGYTDSNFRGVGQQLSTTFTAGSGIVLNDNDMVRRASLQFETNFVEPRLKQSLNSLQVSAFARDYASYQVPLGVERRIGSEIELARPFKKVPNLAGSVSLGVENVGIREGNRSRIESDFKNAGVDISERANQLKGGTFVSFGPSLAYDTRNNILNPTSGWYLSSSLKESLKVAGPADSYGKFTVNARKFLPIGEKSTFTVAGRLGTQVIGDMPEFASFRLGGSGTIRGFREGDAGHGRGFMMTSAEFRTPIPFVDKFTKIGFVRDMRTAFFMDAGTIFSDTSYNKVYNKPGYGISAGMGLMVNVPSLGPIRVDYGYPLSNLGTGVKRSGRFTFGLGDKY